MTNGTANTRLNTARLLEIEALASGARRQAADGHPHFNRQLEHTPDIVHLARAVRLMTGGNVYAHRNLWLGSERVAGFLREEGEFADIYYEEYDPPVRQRFTISHEFGHFLLHAFKGHKVHARCLPGRVDPHDENDTVSETLDQEDEANAFAGAFLMPGDQLSADLAQFGLGIAFLAERYAVSKRAMQRRLKTLELLNGEDRSPV